LTARRHGGDECGECEGRSRSVLVVRTDKPSYYDTLFHFEERVSIMPLPKKNGTRSG